MTDKTALQYFWCEDPREAPALAHFFVANITPDYISHSEIQTGRALDWDRWHPALADIVQTEILDRQRAGNPVLVARRDGVIAGLGMIGFFPAAPKPYAVIEDLVVDRTIRALGVGGVLLKMMLEKADNAGCRCIFLERNLNNEESRAFFEKSGFAARSVVMTKVLKS